MLGQAGAYRFSENDYVNSNCVTAVSLGQGPIILYRGN